MCCSALGIPFQILGAFSCASFRTSVLDHIVSFRAQEFGTDGVEVLGVSLPPLEIGFLVSRGELHEVFGGSLLFLINLSLDFVYTLVIPGELLWLTSRLACALSDSAVIPFWRSH